VSFFDNIPFDGRSKRNIEMITERFLEKVSPDLLKKPAPLDVEKFLTYDLLRQCNIRLEIVENDEIGTFVEGMYDPFENKIIFSEKGFSDLIGGNSRSRFTGAHEGYHAIDHGKQIRLMPPNILLDNLYLCRQKKVRTIPQYQQAEWQANYGAGALLMPRRTLEIVIRDIGSNKNRTFDPVWEVSAVFKVSEQAAKIRIEKLGL
jgi:hypothetical protein